MGRAKDIEIRPITSQSAGRIIREGHYSGKVVRNSQLHLGVFYEGRAQGAMQFGPPLDRARMLPLVRGATWESVLELNRMYLSDALPRNGESRAIAIACRLLGEHAPQVKWIVSFADATQCGDGAIYRASGFLLTQIRASNRLARLPSGTVIHKMSLEGERTQRTRKRPELGGRSYYDITGGKYDWPGFCRKVGAEILTGYQLRYVRFLDPTWRDRLTVPVIPFADIPADARMYKGKRRPVEGPGDQPGKGGSDPTSTLHP